MPKIVIEDSDFAVPDIEKKMIEDAGIEFAHFQDRSAEGIMVNCADADGVITAYGDFNREVFEALPQLQVVSRFGVGYETIDIPAATDCGVAVCNVPGYATEVVSDHAIALCMAVLRRLPEMNADIRKGIWDPTGIARWVKCMVARLALLEWGILDELLRVKHTDLVLP